MAGTGIVEKLGTDVEINSSADKFFTAFGKQAHGVPEMSTRCIQKVQLHEGDWEAHGSVKRWDYTVDGKQEYFKEKMEIDEANKLITLVGLEGHAVELLKTYKAIFHAVPKHGGGATVKITAEYEKFNRETPAPCHYLYFLVDLVKDIDAHLCKA